MSDRFDNDVLRIAAFSDGDKGGNPAGVFIGEDLPAEDEMCDIAAAIGYSETAFAAREGDRWRVRYFSPESEVPFCGHATIALGAALAMKEGEGVFPLHLNDANIIVEGKRVGDDFYGALQSPPTFSRVVDDDVAQAALALFGYGESDLDARIPPALINAGANHLVLALKDRARLAAMNYELDEGRRFMRAHDFVTIALVHAETDQLFHARNAFASGGVLEDPATGAAAAAFGGYLRDLAWPHGGAIEIIQGEDMGATSRLHVEIGSEKASSIRVSGSARIMPA